MTKPAYYKQVVEELLLYREYKQRVLMILQDKNNQLQEGMGIDYSKVSVQTSNCYDSTSSIAMNRLDEELENEFRYKLDLVQKIEIAFEGLDELEKFIISKKYMTGRTEEDVEIYTHPKFPNGKTKYYSQKDKAVKKYAKIRGFIKNELLANFS